MTELTREQVEAMLAETTPGPWVDHPQIPLCVVTQESAGKPIGASVHDDDDRNHYANIICEVYHDRHKRGSPRANARLAAAAPDMARELLAAWDKIEGLEADLDDAVEVAFKRGATEWVRLNYPKHYARLIGDTP